VLASQLEHLGAVSIGAAGTLVIRSRVTRSALRAELGSRLPFGTEIMLCEGRELVRLLSNDVFAGRPSPPGVVRFVSVLSRAPRLTPRLPLSLPSRGQWLLQVLARDGRFVTGQYRRHMKTIGYLGALDRIFGVPATTRNWNTMTAIVTALSAGARGPRSAQPD
jgi:hypothetical protein